MCKRLIFWVSVALVLGLAGSASAALWTDAAPDNNSWCNSENWSPNSVPDAGTPVDINCTAERGPIVDCDAESGDMLGPAYDDDCEQVMDVIGSIFVISGRWRFCEGDNSQATVNIIGSDVTVNGDWRWSDATGSYGIVNVIGSTVSAPRIKLGDLGGGEINISRGGEVISTGEFDVSSESSSNAITINGGSLKARDFKPTKMTIDLALGTIECATFDPEGTWIMDINEGSFTVDGNQVSVLQNYVDLDYITAYDGATGSEIHIDWTEDPNQTTVTASTIVTWATDPNPENYQEDICPQSVELSWTPGVYAHEHDVYLGTDRDDVRDADTTSVPIYRGRQGPNTYDAGVLVPDTTYYWRIDEVNETRAPGLWPGKIWEFSTNDGNAFDPIPEDAETGVSIDPTLTWTPGCWAVTHKVYFGTDRDDVEDGTGGTYKGEQSGTIYEPNTLDYLTWHYWRIEEVNGLVTWAGDVWRFRSRSRIVDVNMVLWYELDEEAGSAVSDSSGYEHHGALVGLSGGGAEWEPNGGRFGGALRFTTEESLAVPSDTLENINSAITVAAWVNLQAGSSDEVAVFDAGDSGDNAKMKLTGLVPDDAGDVVWRAGEDPCDVLVWGDATPTNWGGDWHHLAFLKNEPGNTMKIYFDGIEVESRTGVEETLAQVKNKPFAIGTNNDDQSSEHEAAFDDVRVYDYALSDNEVAGLFRGGDVGKAWAPTPLNGQADVPRDANLAWRQGNYPEFHHVYFGTSFDDVDDATTSSDEYKGQQAVGNETCDLPMLTLNTTYYWRIDEVNDPNVWKGDVWKFAVANFIVVDNFESYNDTDNEIYETWEDGADNWSGAWIDLVAEPFHPSHDIGKQSMQYIYDNAFAGPGYYYSEANLPFDSPQDFTAAEAEALTLYFYGDPDNDINDTEQFYVGLGGSYAQVNYPDMNDLLRKEWTEWNIPISDFNNPDPVDPCAVTTLYIGFGEQATAEPAGDGFVYIDDIRLYPARCIPEYGPPLDFSGDCIVGWAEIGLMAEVWLKGDKYVSPIQAPAAPVVHYEFDETSGDTAFDSSNNYDAVARLEDGNSTDAFWEPAGRFNRCIKFDYQQKKYALQMPTSAFNSIGSQVTISVWVNWPDPRTMPDETNQLFSMHGGPGVAYDPVLGIQTAWQDGELIFWDDTNDTEYEPDTGDWGGGWNHYVFVKDVDAEKLRIYLNADLVSESDSNRPMVFPADNAWLGMATDEPNDWHDEYTGLLDDFKVYDYALTQAEINHLASDGSGYVRLDSAFNLHDSESAGQKAINIRDLAELLLYWLDEKLWP